MACRAPCCVPARRAVEHTTMSWVARNVVDPVRQALRQGLTPYQIGMSLVCGVVSGIFPVPGTTTAVGFGLIYAFKVNPVLVQGAAVPAAAAPARAPGLGSRGPLGTAWWRPSEQRSASWRRRWSWRSSRGSRASAPRCSAWTAPPSRSAPSSTRWKPAWWTRCSRSGPCCCWPSSAGACAPRSCSWSARCCPASWRAPCRKRSTTRSCDRRALSMLRRGPKRSPEPRACTVYYSFPMNRAYLTGAAVIRGRGGGIASERASTWSIVPVVSAQIRWLGARTRLMGRPAFDGAAARDPPGTDRDHPDGAFHLGGCCLV